MSDEIVTDATYVGFAGQMLGAYLGGLLAELVGPQTEVTLRRPVAAGTTLQRAVLADGTATLSASETVVAEGRATVLNVDLPGIVSVEEAERASERYPGHVHHLFPGCFVCGPARQPGDGLRIFPGPIDDRPRLVAAPWIPDSRFADAHGLVPLRFVWSALDCPALWALVLASPADSADLVVTGSIAVKALGPIASGEPHVVLGWPLGEKGRLLWAAAAVLSATGELRAVARQTCVRTNWGMPLGLSTWLDASRGPS
jgi:hypothetical protein